MVLRVRWLVLGLKHRLLLLLLGQPLLLPAFLTQSLQELLLPQVLIRQVNFWRPLSVLLLLLLPGLAPWPRLCASTGNRFGLWRLKWVYRGWSMPGKPA